MVKSIWNSKGLVQNYKRSNSSNNIEKHPTLAFPSNTQMKEGKAANDQCFVPLSYFFWKCMQSLQSRNNSMSDSATKQRNKKALLSIVSNIKYDIVFP